MLALLLIVVCVVVRIVPHPPNVAPVGAAGVLAGRTLPTWLAIGVVVAAMAISNLALAWMHGWPAFGWGSPFIYGGFALQVLIARALRRRRGGAIAAAIAGALVFFALSNLGVWVAGGLYPRDAAGLAACYLAALPFLAGTVIGDLVWTVALTQAHRALGWRLVGRGRWVRPEALAAPAL